MFDAVSTGLFFPHIAKPNHCSHLGKYAIWIDGLCTNQEDADDKAIQVGQMGSVYKLADGVMTVLNSPTAETDFLLDRENWTSESMSTERDRMHKTMLAVLANDYWRRTWVLQEVVLGREITVCCGRRAVSFDDLSSLFNRLRSHQSVTQFARGVGRTIKTLIKTDPASDSDAHEGADGGNFGDHDMAIFSREGRAKFQSVPFLDILDKSRRWNRCFDPKDMLYARRGLASDGEALIPDVIYNKNRSVQDVYKDFAGHCVTTPSRTNLRVITLGSWLTDGALPSWVPDWRVPAGGWQGLFNESNEHGAENDDYSDSEQYTHSDSPILQLRWSGKAATVSPNGNRLNVQGRVLATITLEQQSLFVKEHGAIHKLVTNQLRRRYEHKMDLLLPNPPAPEAKDLICILSGCPAFVFLRAVKGTHKHEIVGKHRKFQNIAVQHCLTGIVAYEEERKKGGHVVKRWSFVDIKAVNKLPEESFTIV